jgi:hypothetical protein
LLPGGLSEKDFWHIAYAVRRYLLQHKQDDHPLLKNYDHYLKVPMIDLVFWDSKFVYDQLLELETQGGPFPVGAARATARKLQGRPPPKRRRVVTLRRSRKGK